MTSPQIEVTTWTDLDHLIVSLGQVGTQVEETVAYAVGWMCQPDGFATSPACVLRPLAEVMELVGDAFAEAGRRYLDDWERVRDAVAVAQRELRSGDERAAARSAALLPAVA